jgi:hypothetical protein
MSQEKKSPPVTPPSEEFWSAFTSAGTPVATCGFCGRVTIGLGGRDLDHDEYLAYCEKIRTRPEEYREDSFNDSIGTGELAGRILVYGCPCNEARRYEDFLWSHRLQILDYIKRRTARERREAEHNALAVEALTS